MTNPATQPLPVTINPNGSVAIVQVNSVEGGFNDSTLEQLGDISTPGTYNLQYNQAILVGFNGVETVIQATNNDPYGRAVTACLAINDPIEGTWNQANISCPTEIFPNATASFNVESNQGILLEISWIPDGHSAGGNDF